ncbi:hypothetical protein BDA96_02G101000 [Sorghum bicolor]|jgi:hypothetical protein|uniref:Rx N-terminal domain-containing protein n=2 Tax=Sorghum bicolor TaxID=4558 RepID=A0A921RMJ7_SORBI|nr:uncharacterized protein LOC8054452 isoform X1 [Sorghum bicolor]EER98308.2 hypothetical protein SORBI_3002G097900 [Sorghum bicolor]KAG0542404.1 hypothetical protein BDA96_02G101000 [Sorghum bicolor]|eukprot:XP_002461789.2 uncharacterized protein LOC8054452 isoform X1 [Sorghum bicolor]
MAEMVSSVVIQESFSQILSGLVKKYEDKEEINGVRNIERLEMAHIRLEAALETSNKWQITDTSMLRWQKKLKRAAQECDEKLHKCKQRILEDERMEQEVRNSSISRRIEHATKSFVSSIFNRNNDELNPSVVKRFEWYADGASEFLRFIELGGTPLCHVMPFGSLIKNLFAGKELHHKIVRGSQRPLCLLWLIPFSTAEQATEVVLIFIKKDGTTEGNIYFSMIMQLSESTDIVGIAVRSLQLFAPHVKFIVENITNELTQLPTQDFSWVPFAYSDHREHLYNLQNLASQWFRPNPLCCKQQQQHEVRHFSNLNMAGLSDVPLEPVIEFHLLWQVSHSVYSKGKTSLSEGMMCLQNSPYLKAGIAFAPHGSSEDILPLNRSSETVEIAGGQQHVLHTDISLEQLEEIMLSKAIDYFCHNAEETVYQMIWRSKHGAARIYVEKPSINTRRTSMRAQRTFGGPSNRKLLRGQDQKIGNFLGVLTHFLDLWGAHVPIRLQSSLMDWMQKERARGAKLQIT